MARQCYLGNGVTLLPNTKLEPGCVVASNVTLGPDVTVPRASLLVGKPLYDTLDEFERDDEPGASITLALIHCVTACR